MASGSENTSNTVVAAIDIGTTHSGYAYAFTSHPECVHFGPDKTKKELSSILLNNDGSFHSFGQEAIDTFNKLDHDSEEGNEFYHCLRFPKYIKINDNKNYVVYDQLQKAIPAVVVFSEVLKYFIREVTKATKTQVDDIRWYIVDSIKYESTFCTVFLEAIANAGIRKANMKMVNESLAATQYCIKQVVPQGAFIVANLGGEAIHLSVYEALPENCGLKSLGGVRENGKNKASVQTNYHIDQQLMQLLGSDFQNDKVNKEGFLDGCFREVEDTLREMLSNFKSDYIVKIYLVGGLSENRCILEKLQDAFKDLDFIALDQPGLAVLHGAILMGICPLYVTEMRSRFALGFSHNTNWGQEDTTNQSEENRDLRKVFKKFLSKDDVLSCSDKHSRTVEIHSVSEKFRHSPLVSEVWRSKKENPEYCSKEEKCELWLRKVVNPPSNGWSKRLKYREELAFLAGLDGKLTIEIIK